LRRIIVVFAVIALSLSGMVFANGTVKIEDVSKRAVIESLIHDWSSKGFSVSSNTGNEVTFRKLAPDQNFMELYGVDSELQVTFGIMQTGNDVEISAKAEAATKLSNGQKVYWDLNMPELKTYLTDLQNGFNGYLGYGLEFTNDKDNWVIKCIIPGGNAEKVRLRTGDIIVSVNDKPAKDLSMSDINAIFSEGGEGAMLELIVKGSNGEEIKVTLTKTKIPPRLKR
jgi:hypothetical protein